jgi:hypothetical protein
MAFAGQSDRLNTSLLFPAWKGLCLLWWGKMALGQVFSEYFGFPCQFSFHWLLHTHHLSSGTGTIGQLMADIPSGLSLPPPRRGGTKGPCLNWIGGWMVPEPFWIWWQLYQAHNLITLQTWILWFKWEYVCSRTFSPLFIVHMKAFCMEIIDYAPPPLQL